LIAGYSEDEVAGEKRTLLRLHPRVAPYTVCVLPLSKKPELKEVAERIYGELSESFSVAYDDTQSIGKRYRRQDEIGTPFCVTVDFDTLTDGAVTVRDRDSTQQIRIPISELYDHISLRVRTWPN
jgi:glycyl-tRNA synthetase